MKTPTLLIPLIASSLAGCANSANLGLYPQSPYSSGTFTAAAMTGGPFSDGTFQCPNQPNIQPDDPTGSSGTFSVCTDPQSPSTIMVHGYAEDSQICVFPVDYVSSTQIYAQPDPITPTQPWNICVDVWIANSTGAMIQFPNITFNAVFIVPGGNQQNMLQCLISGNNSTCPQYSYGQFR